MTDQKRDESMDVQIICRDHVPCDDYAGHWYSLKVTPKMLPIAPGDTLDRFVPHSDLVAAEAKTEKLRESLDMLLDEINAAPLAIHGGNGDIKRFELALKVAREFSNEGRP